MSGASNGSSPAWTVPSPSRSPWQLLYTAIQDWLRRRRQADPARLPRPVVSIGNLHLGGGGKTPLTAAVAAHLRDSGYRVCVLSRGYGAAGDGGPRVVSDGRGGGAAEGTGSPGIDPRRAGDEPAFLADALPGVAVVVGAERAAAGRLALERLPEPPDLFLLDDGFAHAQLHRDLDLLAFPAADPFAGGRLLPSGRLRQPLSWARHADGALLTGLSADDVEGTSEAGAGRSRADDLAAALQPFGFAGPVFACALVAEPLTWVDGAEAATPGATLLPVCAIARPAGFLATAHRAARDAGFTLAEAMTFRDHHAYPQRTLESIRRTARDRGATAVLTTGKDRVKLAGRLGLPLAEVPVRARPEARFWDWLDARLAQIPAPAPPAPATEGGA